MGEGSGDQMPVTIFGHDNRDNSLSVLFSYHMVYKFFTKGAHRISQWLRAHPTLAEDSSLVPSIMLGRL